MRIGKLSFVMIKDRGVMLVESIKNRNTECGETNDKIVEGVFLNSRNIGLEGESSKNFLNLKTCSVKEIDQFLADNKNYDSDYSRKEWAYLSDVQTIVNRDFFKEDYYFEVRKISIPEMRLYKCVSLRGHFHPLVDFEV